MALLLLGEGNFTFARSLARQRDQRLLLIATSFDTGAEVRAKYPESEAVLSELSKDKGVLILHGIDATRSLQEQLTRRAVFVPIESVLFNFPHLGIEDAKAHGCMLAHVLHCAKEVLTFPHSLFFVALANAQAERWMLRFMASKNGMYFVDQKLFVPSDWPGYEAKRHISGKSFSSRVQECSFYCFSAAPLAFPEPSPSPLSSLEHEAKSSSSSHGAVDRASLVDANSFLHLLHLLDFKSSKTNEAAASSAAVASSQGKKAKSKKSVLVLATDGQFSVLTLEQRSTIFSCNVCLQQFALEQGVRSHIYDCHVKAKKTTVPVAEAASSSHQDLELHVDLHEQQDHKSLQHQSMAEKVTAATNVAVLAADGSGGIQFRCEMCEKLFVSKEALVDHETSAHGKYRIVKPKWAAVAVCEEGSGNKAETTAAAQEEEEEVTQAVAESAGATHECNICCMRFTSLDLLLEHLNKGFQPHALKQEYLCSTCSKCFSEERALLQHMNRCTRVPK